MEKKIIYVDSLDAIKVSKSEIIEICSDDSKTLLEFLTEMNSITEIEAIIHLNSSKCPNGSNNNYALIKKTFDSISAFINVFDTGNWERRNY